MHFARLRIETLESRNLMASVPFGAQTDDTGEYMIGDIYVTVVLFESDPMVSPNDSSTEDWNSALIQDTKTKIQEGLQWWQDTLENEFPNNSMPLNFVIDFQYADNPVRTGYEPINRPSNFFQTWMYDFLNKVGYGQTQDFNTDIRAFNNFQRVTHDTDWAFTIFVVNSTNDPDDTFAAGGQFSRAFSYAGGQFMVVPSGRPASTYAHETGHQFWAKDEYAGGGLNSDTRGYYNSRNSNAIDGAPSGFVQDDSIMSNGTPLANAFANNTTDDATLAMLGWQDSDGDGIFDVLDVPFTLSGSGAYDAASGKYKFKGSSAVQTLPNRNSSGLQNDITINQISRAQYRVDGGAWQTAATYGTYAATLDLSFNVPAGSHTVELRTIDDVTGVTSSIFQGTTDRATTMSQPGINGVVFNDTDSNSSMSQTEKGLAGWTVQLVDANKQPINLLKVLEPDSVSAGTVLSNFFPNVTLSSYGLSSDNSVLAGQNGKASTGSRVFQSVNNTIPTSQWNQNGNSLKIQFSSPISTLSIDAIGDVTGALGRLEVFDSNNKLLARYNTSALGSGVKETMTLTRAEGDIAYATVSGRGSKSILLDNLRYGAATTTVTDAFGGYSLPALPAGSYTVMATPPSGWLSYDAAPVTQLVNLASGASVGMANLAQRGEINAWRNPTNALDVNKDSFVAPIDALIVINYLNSGSQLTLPPLNGATPNYYYDVDGDGTVAPIDVLQIINRLNSPTGEEPSVPSGNQQVEINNSAAAFSGYANVPVPKNEHVVVLSKYGVISLEESEGESELTPTLVTQSWDELEVTLKAIAPTIAKAYLLDDVLGDTHTHDDDDDSHDHHHD